MFREPGGQGAEKAGDSHAQVRNDKVRWCVPFGDLPELETTDSNSPFASASNPVGSPSPEFKARSALNH